VSFFAIKWILTARKWYQYIYINKPRYCGAC
jgi:hypothetical protein